jgi:hypothetical protein
MDESARRAVHLTLRDGRSKSRRACHASFSSARMARARAMRSPGSVIRRGEGAACCAEESLEPAALWSADRGASYKGPRSGPHFWAAPVWTAAASAKLGKCDRGSAPDVGSLEPPTGLFDPWPLLCIARPTSQVGYLKPILCWVCKIGGATCCNAVVGSEHQNTNKGASHDLARRRFL